MIDKTRHNIQFLIAIITVLISFSLIINNYNDNASALSGLVTSSTSCADSDNGKNIYARGQTSGNDGRTSEFVTAVDICVDQNVVKENYCDDAGMYWYAQFRCPYGCVDGACLPPPSSACGNGIIEPGEECDGNNLGLIDTRCIAYGSTFSDGLLQCTNCKLDSSKCVLKTTETQSTATLTIPLNKGWNTISSNIIPVDTSIGAVFASVKDYLVLVKDLSNGYLYYPKYNKYQIPSFEFKKAYQVYMNNTASLVISGIKANPTEIFNLNYGWNYISYLPQEKMLIEQALASIKDNISIVVAPNGSAYSKNPFTGGYINNIGHMFPGVGYQIYMKEAREFVYNFNLKYGCVPLLINGDPNTKLDILILGRGYTQDGMDVFRNDAPSFMNNLLSVEPYTSYKSVMNFYRIDRVDPVLDYFNIPSLECPWDQIIVSLNQNQVDGGGDPSFDISSDFRKAPQEYPYLIIHEFSHAFGDLIEEYWVSSDAMVPIKERHEVGLGFNCDEAGCPLWCSSTYSKEELSQIDCSKDRVSCNQDSGKGLPCKWLDKSYYSRWITQSICVNTASLCTSINPSSISSPGEVYEKTMGQCILTNKPDIVFGTIIPSNLEGINIGKSCIENGGCYKGCTAGNYYRSSYSGGIMGIEGSSNIQSSFSPQAYRVLVDKLKQFK